MVPVSNAPDFTIIALPDTQYYSENVGGTRAAIYTAQTDWIVSQKDYLNIAFVMHLGDVTNFGDTRQLATPNGPMPPTPCIAWRIPPRRTSLRASPIV